MMLNILFLLVLVLYSLGAYQAWQVIRLSFAVSKTEVDSWVASWFVLAWPYITLKDIFTEGKEDNVGE